MALASAQPSYPGVIMVAMHPGWVQTEMGGAGAPLTVQTSVLEMRRTLSRLTMADRGHFMDHDGRRFESW
jgi:hypothetical protein